MLQVKAKVNKTFEATQREYKLVWNHIITFIYFHLAGLYGVYLLPHVKFYTILWSLLLHQMTTLGITAGVHRLWSHRSYKAKLPLKILLVICQTVAQQGSVIGWAINHRIHHKFSDTDADPHNARRGLFFSHVGWTMVHYHPLVLEKRKKIDTSDLTSDPILVFQRKYFLILMPLLAFVIPSVVPYYFWNESLNAAFHVNIVRYLVDLHLTFLINSWAHAFGNKPYNRHILPGENVVCSLLTQGEGFHNYHHTFPSDYKTSEWGYRYSWTTAFIDLMAKIGWAYDLKTTPPELVRQIMQNKGDGTMYSLY